MSNAPISENDQTDRQTVRRIGARDVTLGALAVGLGLAFAVEYADVVTQAVLTSIQYLIELAVAMMIAPGQAGSASTLVLVGLVATLCVGAALAVVFVWRTRRRRSEYG